MNGNPVQAGWGQAQGAVCERCRKPLSPTASFCPRCGAAVVLVARAGVQPPYGAQPSAPPALHPSPPPRPMGMPPLPQHPGMRAAPPPFVPPGGPMMGARSSVGRPPVYAAGYKPGSRNVGLWTLLVALIITIVIAAGMFAMHAAVTSPFYAPRVLTQPVATPDDAPATPEPATAEPAPSPNPNDNSAAIRIDRTWIETAAVDPLTGNVGIAIHVAASAGYTPGMQLVTHFATELGPVTGSNPAYSDSRGQAATSVAMPDNQLGRLIDLRAFIPLSALVMPIGAHDLQVMPWLYDSSNVARVSGPVSHTMLSIAAAAIQNVRVPASNPFDRAATRSILVTVSGPVGGGATGRVVAIFKDHRGLTLHGNNQYSNAAGELSVRAPFEVGAGETTTVTLSFPADIVPIQTATAEVRLLDGAQNRWLSAPVTVKVN